MSVIPTPKLQSGRKFRGDKVLIIERLRKLALLVPSLPPLRFALGTVPAFQLVPSWRHEETGTRYRWHRLP